MFFNVNKMLRYIFQVLRYIPRSVLLYGAPHLVNTSPKTAKKLQNELHTTLDIPKVCDFTTRRHVIFFDSLKYYINPTFKTLTPKDRPMRW